MTTGALPLTSHRILRQGRRVLHISVLSFAVRAGACIVAGKHSYRRRMATRGEFEMYRRDREYYLSLHSASGNLPYL